jgi:putative SOS response-associated peptidase YedK
MCSRYSFVPEPRAWADFRAVLGALAEELLGLAPKPKLAPTDTVPILVRPPGGPPQVVHARWGFIPHWWSKPELPRLSFNARSEEAATKPMWRDALRRSRCLIPATSWTEWQKAQAPAPAKAGVKIPHTLARHDGLGFMFAGLWSSWRPRPDAEARASCVILTMPAAPALITVHDRMPIVLAPEAWNAWLDPSATEPAQALALLRDHAVRALVATTVDRH